MMFALFMIVILLVTGFIWLLDILVLSKKRQAGVMTIGFMKGGLS